ncbi:MAG: hypothetical protein HY326_07055 [Chloroflexi bacterium]|nr:hypothetical protein [Chloroflexota bacterium]
MPEPFEVSVWSPTGQEEIKIPHPELERLVAAACINTRFGRLFLANPVAAAEAGYQGHPFLLSGDEKTFLHTLKAPTIQLLARQVAMWISGNADQIMEISLEESVVSPQLYTLPNSPNEKTLPAESPSDAHGHVSASQQQSQPNPDLRESPKLLVPTRYNKLRSHSLVFVWSLT